MGKKRPSDTTNLAEIETVGAGNKKSKQDSIKFTTIQDGKFSLLTYFLKKLKIINQNLFQIV